MPYCESVINEIYLPMDFHTTDQREPLEKTLHFALFSSESHVDFVAKGDDLGVAQG